MVAAPDRKSSTAQSSSVMQFECTNECRFGCTVRKQTVSTLHAIRTDSVSLMFDVALRVRGLISAKIDGRGHLSQMQMSCDNF